MGGFVYSETNSRSDTKLGAIMFFTCKDCNWTSATIIATRNHQLAIEHTSLFGHMVVDSRGYALHEDAKAHGISFGRRTA